MKIFLAAGFACALVVLLVVVSHLLIQASVEPATGTPTDNPQLDSLAAADDEAPSSKSLVSNSTVVTARPETPKDTLLSYTIPSGFYNRIVEIISLRGSRARTEDMELLMYRHMDYHGLWHDFNVLQPTYNDRSSHVPLEIRVNVVNPRVTSDSAQFSYTLLPGNTLRLHSPQDTLQLKWIRLAISEVANEDILRAH